MNADIFNAARVYAKRGWIVHPLSSPQDEDNSAGKRPLIKGWQQLDKVSDIDFAKWFGNIDPYFKGCNIGLQCGKRSNVTVIDFDNLLFAGELFNGLDIETLQSSRTKGRGHIYFKYNPNLPASKHHNLGIEILSDGSNAVLPPSVHKFSETYHWNDPDVPIIEMPKALEDNLKRLFQTEIELKQIIAKSRHCFRDILKSKPDMHGAEGREYMLAVCTDLKAKGATEEHIKMLARLMYGAEYNEARTLTEWRNIDPAKTWQCDTLKAKLPAYVLAQCEKMCDKRRQEDKINAASAVLKPLAEITCLGIAENLQRQTPIHFDKSGNFWIWNKDHYERIDETDILNELRQIIDSEKHILGRAKPAIMDAIKMTGRMRTVKHVPKTWIHIQGAIVDLKTGERIDPSPEYLLTAPIPHKLGLTKETPTIDRLFTEWVGADKKQLLYEICAYCLLDDYPIHRVFLLFGRGRNGKGQFKEIVVRLVGHENTTSTSIEGLIKNRFESARLYKKKVATIGETNFAVLEDTAIIKMLTGGDIIPAEFKNKIPFEFYNTAKLLINTNSLPPTTDKTDAFYSRFIVVQFPNQFQKGKDIVDMIPPEEYDNLLLKCIDILRDLLERGEFTNEGTIQDKAQVYEALSNPLNEFIEDRCYKDINGAIPVWKFIDAFTEYLSSRGLRQLSDREIRKQLEDSGYELEPNYRFKEHNGKQWTALRGLRWKSEYSVGVSDTTIIVPSPTKTEPLLISNVGVVGDVGVLSLSPYIVEANENSPTSPTSPTNLVTELIEQAGNQWQLQHGQINSSNLTEFTLWYCEQAGNGTQPSQIREIAENIFKITPEPHTKNDSPTK